MGGSVCRTRTDMARTSTLSTRSVTGVLIESHGALTIGRARTEPRNRHYPKLRAISRTAPTIRRAPYRPVHAPALFTTKASLREARCASVDGVPADGRETLPASRNPQACRLHFPGRCGRTAMTWGPSGGGRSGCQPAFSTVAVSTHRAKMLNAASCSRASFSSSSSSSSWAMGFRMAA